MKRLLHLLLMPAVLAGLGLVEAPALARGHRGDCYGCRKHEGPPPHWCDPYADLHPWPYDNHLITGPRNWAWYYPDGGFTAYPGLPGSGVPAPSDYSHVNWVVPPHVNAKMVIKKLEMLGVPLVPQETIYLGKNPGQVNKAKLPVPNRWLREAEKAKEKEPDKKPDPDKDAPDK